MTPPKEPCCFLKTYGKDHDRHCPAQRHDTLSTERGTVSTHVAREMTAEVRASHMAIDIVGSNIPGSMYEYFLMHLKQAMDEAVLDAFDRKWKNEHKRCLEIEYSKGFSAARAQAAKIAEDDSIEFGNRTLGPANPFNDGMLKEALSLRDRIMAMKPEAEGEV